MYVPSFLNPPLCLKVKVLPLPHNPALLPPLSPHIPLLFQCILCSSLSPSGLHVFLKCTSLSAPNQGPLLELPPLFRRRLHRTYNDSVSHFLLPCDQMLLSQCGPLCKPFNFTIKMLRSPVPPLTSTLFCS